MYYRMNVAGLDRDLPICKVTDDLYIGAFIVFGDAEFIFCVTITGTLSGSFNAASVAKKQYEQDHPGRRVFVLDSLSTGPEMALLLEAIEERVMAGLDFDTVCREVAEYHQRKGV